MTDDDTTAALMVTLELSNWVALLADATTYLSAGYYEADDHTASAVYLHSDDGASVTWLLSRA